MRRYLEIKKTTNTYDAKLKALNLSRMIWDCRKGGIFPRDTTKYAYALSYKALRVDENGNEVWGLECNEDKVIKIHPDIEESYLLGQLCQILPDKLLEEGGLQFLKDAASDLIAKRDDLEVTITMADIASIGDGVFVDFEDESLDAHE